MLETCASIFAGGGGWEVGALAAGLRPRWSLDNHRESLLVGDAYLEPRAPGHMAIVADVAKVDPTRLEPVDVLFASPPCQAHSRARLRKGVVPRADAEIGQYILGFIRALRPEVVFIENVTLYTDHPVLHQLLRDAEHLGYAHDVHRIVATDVGVPQTRARMVARLSRRALPAMAPKVKAPSWWEAVRDLAPTFQASALAPWQQARVKRMFDRGFVPDYPLLISSNNCSSTRFCAGKTVRVARQQTEPAFTVVATSNAMSATRVVDATGRITQVDTRAFVRWQTFPDDYDLPTDKVLATRVLGNAVPPRMALELLRPFVGGAARASGFPGGPRALLTAAGWNRTDPAAVIARWASLCDGITQVRLRGGSCT